MEAAILISWSSCFAPSSCCWSYCWRRHRRATAHVRVTSPMTSRGRSLTCAWRHGRIVTPSMMQQLCHCDDCRMADVTSQILTFGPAMLMMMTMITLSVNGRHCRSVCQAGVCVTNYAPFHSLTCWQVYSSFASDQWGSLQWCKRCKKTFQEKQKNVKKRKKRGKNKKTFKNVK